MSPAQKRALASVLLRQAGNIVEFPELRDVDELDGVSGAEVADQLGTWLRRLPGEEWDSRLGEPWAGPA